MALGQAARMLFTVVALVSAVVVVRYLSDYYVIHLYASQKAAIAVANRSPIVMPTTDEILYFNFGVGDRIHDDDDRLVDHIRAQIARQSPSRPHRLADISGRRDFSQHGQSALVDRLLGGRRGGFFVDCGAFDGEDLSNTIFFELERNWTGLLIEANPKYHRTLLEKNRRAFVLGACLSPTARPSRLTFQPASYLGGLVDKFFPGHLDAIKHDRLNATDITVNCYPFNAIMAAVGVTHIDYFSLDIEGPEFEVLQTIDWRRLRIDVLTIESPVGGGEGKVAKLANIRKMFANTKMYREATTIGPDVVFERLVGV